MTSMTNQEAIAKINELFSVYTERRDAAWEKSFLQHLPMVPVTVLAAEPKEGPDHWPYLMVGTESASGGPADDSIRNIVEWLSDKGIGLVLNPMKPIPDYVLSYGMIWNFKERGEFISEAKALDAGKFDLKPGQKLWTGAPSEAYLPPYVRSVLKQFLADQGVFTPKVLMVNFNAPETAPNQKPDQMTEAMTGYDLCFSIESLKSPPVSEHANIAEALSWFLPAHYSVSLVSEKAVPGFAAL